MSLRDGPKGPVNKSYLGSGAGEGNRTPTTSLEGWGSTIELHPLAPHSSNRLRPAVRSDRRRRVRRRSAWWRGLDSNQRTLSRADLQSAAFNHSATPPARHPAQPAKRRRELSVFASPCQPITRHGASPRRPASRDRDDCLRQKRILRYLAICISADRQVMADGRKARRPKPSKPSPGRPAGRPGQTAKDRLPAAPASEGRPRAGDGLFIDGVHPVASALTNPRRRCRRLWCTEDGEAALADALHRAKALGLVRPAPERVDRRELDGRTAHGVHQGIVLAAEPLAPPRLEDLVGRLAAAPAVLVVLDQVTDPHNVGAILRSAAVFGARGVIVTDRHAPAETGALARAASGALELVPLLRVVNLARTLAWLKAEGFVCLGLDEGGTASDQLPGRGERLALVLGAEGDGLRRLTREGCDALIRLPAVGPMTTLNVSCAAAVALYAVTAAARP